jgi:hypothetical protein
MISGKEAEISEAFCLWGGSIQISVLFAVEVNADLVIRR